MITTGKILINNKISKYPNLILTPGSIIEITDKDTPSRILAHEILQNIKIPENIIKINYNKGIILNYRTII
jgi:ribosomal protein S4